MYSTHTHVQWAARTCGAIVMSVSGKYVNTATKEQVRGTRKMQVLCEMSMTSSDARCTVCGQGFAVYGKRLSKEEQELARRQVMDKLRSHHHSSDSPQAHPVTPFNVPDWDGLPKFSAAALLGAARPWAA